MKTQNDLANAIMNVSSDRKRRLVCLAWIRRTTQSCLFEKNYLNVEALLAWAELFADREVNEEAIRRRLGQAVFEDTGYHYELFDCIERICQPGVLFNPFAISMIMNDSVSMKYEEQGQLLKEICNPPIGIISKWKREWDWGEVKSLARAVYEERDRHFVLEFDRLAVLSDALEENGAPDELLAVVRSPTYHFRGFWPVDTILGKT